MSDSLRQTWVLIVGLVSQLLGSIRFRGLGILLISLKESLWFDCRYGVRTFLVAPKRYQLLRSLSDASWQGMMAFKDANEYAPVLTSVMAETLQVIRASLGQKVFGSMQFCDLGCGKGKPLLVFHLNCRQFNNCRMVGIDYDPMLIDICRDNMARLKITPSAYRVVCDLASSCLRYLDDPPYCIYIIGSFHGQTLQKTLGSVDPFPHVLCYIDPPELSVFERFGYTLIDQRKGGVGVDSWLIFAKHLSFVSPWQSNA